MTIRAQPARLPALLLASALSLGLLVPGAAVRAREAQPVAQDPVVEARLVQLSEEFRCLVCQNESLASSRADLAADLREELRGLIREKRSDDEIKTFLVQRYGDYVLYRPPVKPMTWVLWFGPFALLLLALVGVWRVLRRPRQDEAPVLAEQDLQRTADLLREQDRP